MSAKPGTRQRGSARRRVPAHRAKWSRVARDGRLVPAPDSPFPAQGPGPLGSEFRPTDPGQLLVSNAHGAANAGTVSAFRVDDDGTLTSIGASTFPAGTVLVEITHDGRFLCGDLLPVSGDHHGGRRRSDQQVPLAGIRAEGDPRELRLAATGQHGSLVCERGVAATFANATGVDADTVRATAAAALPTGRFTEPTRSRRWSRCSRPIAPPTSLASTT